MQSCFHSFARASNIGLIMLQFHSIVLHFCISIQKPPEAPNSDNGISRGLEMDKQGNIIEAEKPSTLTQRKPSESIHGANSLNNILSGLSKRYKTLKCFEVDYFDLKACVFSARSSPADFYGEYLQRNSHIVKGIAQYSAEFQRYLKRMQVKNQSTRLNKFFTPQKALNQTTFLPKRDHFEGGEKDDSLLMKMESCSTSKTEQINERAEKRKSEVITKGRINVNKVMLSLQQSKEKACIWNRITFSKVRWQARKMDQEESKNQQKMSKSNYSSNCYQQWLTQHHDRIRSKKQDLMRAEVRTNIISFQGQLAQKRTGFALPMSELSIRKGVSRKEKSRFRCESLGPTTKHQFKIRTRE